MVKLQAEFDVGVGKTRDGVKWDMERFGDVVKAQAHTEPYIRHHKIRILILQNNGHIVGVFFP